MTRILRAVRGRTLALAIVLPLFCYVPAGAQQQSLATLRGSVADEFGGVIVGAVVTIADAGGIEKTAATDEAGDYSFPALAPGRYTVRVTAAGFAAYENSAVEIAAGRTGPLNVTLAVAIEQEVVTVTAEAPVSTEPENNAGAVVLRGADLDALPDDPEDLAEALQALAGPSAGGDGGGEFFIDGFTSGRLPPKESIREVRINRNPFSAEYDRIGYGRTEIFTKPGTDRFRGQSFFNFNDESLNSRNPFAPTRASYQARRYGGNISGPLKAGRASFFLDFERNEIDDNDVVSAITLGPSLDIVPFSETVLTPSRRTTFSPRIDYQLSQNHTIVGRYTYERSRRENDGIGGFSLPSRAFDSAETEHALRLTETAIINQKIINETRFQYLRERGSEEAVNSAPTIRVLDAFTGGGSQVGLSFSSEDRYELSNFTSWAVGDHSLKAGGRLRAVRFADVSPQNFGGTFTFGGGLAPQLDANNQPVLNSAGQIVTGPITSIERYRRTLLLQQLGLSAAEVRARGGGATQFSIAGGNPEARVTQVDFSPFFQGDWRLRNNLTLSLGLRVETQTNIDSSLNFAPRLAFAYSPGAVGGSAGGGGGGRQQQQQRMVIRGGVGIFYERVNENLTLAANRFDGINQQQFVVTGSTPAGLDVLNIFPNVPSIPALVSFAIPQTTRRVAEDLRAPYTIQTAISVERQLPLRVTLSVNFINARTLHVLRSRNVNAPLPGTFVPGERTSGIRPRPDLGNIFQYESSGRFNQNQLIISANNRFSRKLTLFANYVLNRARGDSDGTNTFPINQYDLESEYGRSLQDIRHRFFLGGAINALPWGLRLNPFVVANSGRPFNITTGRDINGDTLFTERPAFADDQSKPGVLLTRYGAFDPNPAPGQLLIPRNFGTGPAFFTVNLRVSRTFNFGAAQEPGTGQAGAAGGGRPRGGGGTFGDASAAEGRYSLTFSVNAQNLLNRTNLGTPVGNLSSPLFGQSTTTAAGRFGFGRGGGGGGGDASAGNRRFEVQLRFSF